MVEDIDVPQTRDMTFADLDGVGINNCNSNLLGTPPLLFCEGFCID